MAVRLWALHAVHPLSPGSFVVCISARSSVDPRAIVRLEGLGQLKNSWNKTYWNYLIGYFLWQSYKYVLLWSTFCCLLPLYQVGNPNSHGSWLVSKLTHSPHCDCWSLKWLPSNATMMDVWVDPVWYSYNFMIKWVASVLYILGVWGSSLGPETICSDWGFSFWFSAVRTNTYQ
jgi:hypothetical protein